VEQIGDLDRGHHLIASKTPARRNRGGRGGWDVRKGGHGEQDAPNPADIARASQDVFEDVRRTSSDILYFSLQTRTRNERLGTEQVANDNLRAALQDAGLAPDDLAQIVQVDVRTVRRWLSGGTPYARQRGKVARALDVPEHDLWPDIATPPPGPPVTRPSDLVAAYAAASDLAAPDWKGLMRAATDRIDLLGDALIEMLGTPGVPELLAAKATQGCAVRILIYDTRQHIAPLLDQPGIEVRVLEVPARYVIHRFDDELLLTLHVVGGDPDHAPLIHLRRAASEGLFDRLAEYYSDLWNQDSEPLRPGFDLEGEEEPDEDEDPAADARLSAPDRPEAGPSEPSAPPARRWPGRAQGSPHRG
jgi:hypothetical protein